jgi:hypothetical protein
VRERNPASELVDHRQRFVVTVARRGLDMLATHGLRIPTGMMHHAAQTVSRRGLTGEHGES